MKTQVLPLTQDELGQARMNPNAKSTNCFKLPKTLCPCPETGLVRKDTYSANPADDTLKVVSVTVDGVVYPIDADKQVSLDSANVAASALPNPLENALNSVLSKVEVGSYIKCSYASSTLTILHKGVRRMTTITLSDASTLSLTAANL